MKKLKLLHKILLATGMWHLVTGFVTFFLISGFILTIVEPGINRYGDALWFLFESFTTIGYGDFAATNIFSRVITVVVSFYGILIVAFIPAVVLSYTRERARMRVKKSMVEFLDKLERLPELTKEELAEMSESVKKHKDEL